MSRQAHEVTQIDINRIDPGQNDRTQFDPKKLRELADSISENGLIQPVTVRPIGPRFQIIAGERRTRAIRLLGWETVPCIVAPMTDEEASAVMLTENVGRDDLDPVDEARAYQSRIDQYGWSVEDCAQRAGVSTIRVNFRLKLLKLRANLQDLVRSGDLQLGYAQILSDANLDANFQMRAIGKLRDNANPTPQWFRRACSDLLEQQAQGALFDMPLFGGPVEVFGQAQEAPADPPLPSTTIPPKAGGSVADILKNQVKFWQEAAVAWDALGKVFKKQECEAAAMALRSALAVI